MAAPGRALGALALVVPALVGCGTGDDGDDTTLTVYAAASLQAPFERLGELFEDRHDGVDVAFNFAGSSDLVAQVRQGAGADVVATADTATMGALETDGLLAGGPHRFASNTLEIAVPPGNPAGVESLGDLTSPGLDLVVCAPEVPCGAASTRLEEFAGLDLHPVSEEQDVTDVLNKVIVGEADAGLVYVTDVEGAGDQVEGVSVAEAASAVNVYPIARVADSPHADLAAQFVRLVLDPDGQAELSEAGFAAP